MTRRSTTTPPGNVGRYRDRIFDDKRHDPYQPPGKYPEPTRCKDCGAVYHKGHWQWGPAPEGARVDQCPACRRIQEKLPAGSLTLEGPFLAAHRGDLLSLIQNEAEHERSEHPLHRVMRIDEPAERIEISTTDIHLPQRIGEALKKAYDGELTVQYGHDEYSVRVRWER